VRRRPLCVVVCCSLCVTDVIVVCVGVFVVFLSLGFFFFWVEFCFFEVGCREEVGGGIRRYTDTARGRERERERVREGRRRSSGERWTPWRSWEYMMWSVMSW
jgi:hypothetical protein